MEDHGDGDRDIDEEDDTDEDDEDFFVEAFFVDILENEGNNEDEFVREPFDVAEVEISQDSEDPSDNNRNDEEVHVEADASGLDSIDNGHDGSQIVTGDSPNIQSEGEESGWGSRWWDELSSSDHDEESSAESSKKRLNEDDNEEKSSKRSRNTD